MNILTDDIKKLIRRLAVPAIVGTLFQTLYNVVDTFFAGKISPEALSALSKSFPVYFVIIATSIGVTVAGTSLIGNSIGEKNEKNSIIMIEENDPEKIEKIIYEKDGYTKIKSASFIAVGAPRGILRTGIQGLSKNNKNKQEIIPLPDNSPYGIVNVNTETCTICLSCVSACPAGALQDNPELPQLLFREDACLQCGICVATCPEKAISLLHNLI